MSLKDRLTELNEADWKNTPKEELVDIDGIEVVGDTVEERLESFIAQIKNPYHFKTGDTPVHISFTEDGPTLEHCLENYFKALKSQGALGPKRRE